MTALLVRLFVRDHQNTADPAVRLRYGRLAGIMGIVTNLLLFAAKLLAGIISGSISIMADAFNNFSDCASSAITLVGFKLSGKPADEHHPYGHARYEYISGLVVSFLVLVIGVEFLQSSLGKILNPAPVEYSTLLLIILALSILLKIWQSLFNQSLGKRIGSATLTATAADSRNDVITTSVVLAGSLIARYTGLALDGWLGLAVSVFILVSGVGLVRDILNPLLGTAPDPELLEALRVRIMAAPSVLGVHDLVVHSYGAGRVFASAHVEMPAEHDLLASHDIIDAVERKVDREMSISLVIHLDPVITADEDLNTARRQVEEAAREIDPALEVHDFRMVRYQSHNKLIFEVTVPPLYKVEDDELRGLLHNKIAATEGDCRCVISIDRGYTSTTGSSGKKRRAE